jgi:hypothetical protein
MNGIYPQIMQIDNHPQIAQMNADGWTSADCADERRWLDIRRLRRCTQMYADGWTSADCADERRWLGIRRLRRCTQMVGHPQIAQMYADG